MEFICAEKLIQSTKYQNTRKFLRIYYTYTLTQKIEDTKLPDVILRQSVP